MIDLYEEFNELEILVNKNVKQLHKDLDFIIQVRSEIIKIEEENKKQEIIRKEQEKIERKKNNMEKLKNMTYWEYMQFKKKLKKERKNKSWDYLVKSAEF